MVPEFASLSEFLKWLAAGPGPMIAAGFAVAYVLERFSFWLKLPHDLKGVITIGIAVGISYLAKSLNAMDVVIGNPDLNQFFQLLVYYLSNQVAYKRYFEVKK